MQRFEYKVVPAPQRGEKVRGAKTGAERFAHALQSLMNALGQQGWEYVRADTLPSEERTGFTGRTTVYQNMLVFRRPLEVPAAADVTPAVDVEEPAAASRLSFGRLRLGPARDASTPQVAPRLTTALPAGSAPPLGPAGSDPADADRTTV